MNIISFGTICLLVLSSCILVSSNPVFSSKSKKSQIKFIESNLVVRCATADYSSKEHEKAAKEACIRHYTKGKCLGVKCQSTPKVYSGSLERIQDSYSSFPHGDDTTKYFFRFPEQTLLTWPLKNKFRVYKAPCEVVVEWTSNMLQCRVIGAIIKERGGPEKRCNQMGIQGKNSKNGGSISYHPGSPGLSFHPSPGPSFHPSPGPSFRLTPGPSYYTSPDNSFHRSSERPLSTPGSPTSNQPNLEIQS